MIFAGCLNALQESFMRRLHLFEFEDQAWFPAVIRDYMTDFLEFTWRTFRFYDPAVPILQRVAGRMGARDFVDLCSGGGGPWVYLQPRLDSADGAVRVTLTDKYPNLTAFARAAAGAPGITFSAAPVDAAQVPPELAGVRTIFTGLHHLPPPVVQAILQDAADQRAAICIFEFTERRWHQILATPPIVAGIIFLGTPFMRPLTWRRLLFTYVLPLTPLASMWDGVVSQLRSYSVAELTEMTRQVQVEDYVWEVGQANTWLSPLVRVTYLAGYPRQAAAA